MHFAYQGFTHDGGTRCFLFRGIQEVDPPIEFSVEIDLALLFQARVPVQEGPMFCLRLLTMAASGGPDAWEKFRRYHVQAADFAPLLVERAKQVAKKLAQKSPRRPFRKPPSTSNVHLGTTFKEY